MNAKQPRLRWRVIVRVVGLLVAVPMLYLLSCGPVFVLASKCDNRAVRGIVTVMYRPLIFGCEKAGFAGALEMYVGWWFGWGR